MLLYSRSQGAGPPLILLHGLFGSLENLGAIARSLAQAFCVHSLDLPNHGRSPQSPQMNLDTMAEAVRGWMDQQGIEKAFLFGHSLGGKTLMELALKYPERVAKLIVADIAPVQYAPHHQAVFTGLLAITPEALSSRAEAEQILLPFVPELAVRSFLLKNLLKAEIGFAWRMNLPVIYRDYTQLMRGNREGVFTGQTLFLKGGNSDYITELYRAAIMQRFPAAQLKVVANTGHWLHAEKPELIATMSLRFFQQA